MKETTHLLLDIEGTTCPISFVSGVLFPYAKTELRKFLENHKNDAAVQASVEDAWQEWRSDADPESQRLLTAAVDETKDLDNQAIHQYLQHLIMIDRKSTALKDLQGKIWKEGYKKGQIKTKLYAETVATLKDWSDNGLKLAVYSSGSVAAQQLLYSYTSDGDIRDLFCGWFDTHTGNKKETKSYKIIVEQLQVKPNNVTFISDSKAECDAAADANLSTLFSRRSGNPEQEGGEHRVITDLREVFAMLN